MPGFIIQATPAGLEPVTSAVTGRRSNQLSYGAMAARLKQPSSYITHMPALRNPCVSLAWRGGHETVAEPI